jgi:hypothetical protein
MEQNVSIRSHIRKPHAFIDGWMVEAEQISETDFCSKLMRLVATEKFVLHATPD